MELIGSPDPCRGILANNDVERERERERERGREGDRARVGAE
jgi:hypothetical protein